MLADRASGNPLRDPELIGAEHQVLSPHRIAVHRTVIKGRHLQLRHYVSRQHPAVCIEGGNLLGRCQGANSRQQLRQRIVQRQ